MNRPSWLLLTLLAAPLTTAAPPTKAARGVAPAPRRPVVNEYHGVKVQDDYQWLEGWKDPEVQRWSDAQNRHARAVLDRLPARAAIQKRVTELFTWEAPAYFALQQRGGVLFAMKMQPPRQQPLLVVLKSADEPLDERVLVDPVALDPQAHTTIDFFVPSHDGTKVAVSLSAHGTESGDVHVYDVATGKELAPEDVVPRVNSGTAGGSLSWNGDGSGFYYTRHPRGQERAPEDMDFFQQVYFHKLGTPTAEDRYEVGQDFPRIAETELSTSRDGRHVLAIVQNGDGREYAFYLRRPDGTWTRLSGYEDRLLRGRFGHDGALYLLSLKDAPRGKLLRLPLDQPALEHAQVVVPQAEGVLQGFLPTEHHLWVHYSLGGPSQVRRFDLAGKPQGDVPLLPHSSAGGMVWLGGDDVLFANQSYVEPLSWYRSAGADGKVTRTGLRQVSPVDHSDVEVIPETAISKDGTRIPLTILRPKGIALDGNNPTRLTGYGGFAISQVPRFSLGLRAWLEQGGVHAIAHLRGGGEFGDEWHTAGSLTRKQNTFDDFYACIQRLVELKYTRREKLAISGGSNGGLLMGALLTQHPDAVQAVVSHVGIYDMLRVELTPNGSFNVTEYGSVKDVEQFKALYAYSPYHHVVDGTAYPATLLLTGANDPRVDPMHSRKLLARLQAASSSRAPLLLRTSSGGHGGGTALSEVIAQQVDVYAFMFHQLGVKYRPVAPFSNQGGKGVPSGKRRGGR